jgi:integrase
MKLDRINARSKLVPRREPYWQRLSEGQAIGYRRMATTNPGTWIARSYKGAREYDQTPLGDFITLPDEQRYDAAKAAAAAWFQHLAMGGTTDKVTVKTACDQYIEQLKQDNSEAAAADAKGRFGRLVDDDPLAKIDLKKLAPKHLADWKKRVLDIGGTRGSYNRNSASLKAALNLAHRRSQVASDHAWREELKPFENAGGRRTLYLDGKKRQQLVEKASAESRPFFATLNMMPMRPGEVAALKVEHLNAARRELEVPTGKTKARTIPLTPDAFAHFKACAKGKLPQAWLIARADGSQWKKEAWRDEIKLASRKAKLPRATVAYTLRHSVITDLIVGGLDLMTVARLAGTSLVMIDKNYGKLIAEHARSALQKLALA